MENSPKMSFVRSAPLAKVVQVADKADLDRVVLDKEGLDKEVAAPADPADLDRAPAVRAVRPRRSHPHSHDPSRAWAQRPKWRCALIPTPPLREP